MARDLGTVEGDHTSSDLPWYVDFLYLVVLGDVYSFIVKFLSAVYPRPYNPSFGMGACILGVFFAATFSMLFPLIGLPLVVLLFLTLVAHRYLVGYVYGRTERGQSGGLLQLWIIRRFATMLALQPFLLGLILLSNHLWILAGVLLGSAAFLVILVELYTEIRLREPGVGSLSPEARTSLDNFTNDAKTDPNFSGEEKDLPARPEVPGRSRHQRSRTSLASVLDMISLTLAVGASSSRPRGPVPLCTFSIPSCSTRLKCPDDLSNSLLQ